MPYAAQPEVKAWVRIQPVLWLLGLLWCGFGLSCAAAWLWARVASASGPATAAWTTGDEALHTLGFGLYVLPLITACAVLFTLPYVAVQSASSLLRRPALMCSVMSVLGSTLTCLTVADDGYQGRTAGQFVHLLWPYALACTLTATALSLLYLRLLRRSMTRLRSL